MSQIDINQHLKAFRVHFGITKTVFVFAYKPPTTYRKHAYNTDGQLLCNVRNITASYKLNDIGLYLLLSKFVVRIQTVGSGTVRTKTSSSWDDSHKREFFSGTIHPGRFAQMVKKWNKKFLIENFKLQ